MEESLADFVRALPKAELHVHIEGTLEPELMFELAARNGVELPYTTAGHVREAYQFTDLQSFLDIYNQAASVLRTPQDFYDLMAGYLDRAIADGVTRAEIFFDPQIHTVRGVDFEHFMAGFATAQEERRGRIDSQLIMCFVRHLPEDHALETLAEAEPYLGQIIAVGLDSTEVGIPPETFQRVFRRAREMGLRAVAHAGEEGPPEYVWSALDVLGAERIDHGVRALADPKLVDRLVEEQIPLTVCPLSNLKLQGVAELSDHPILRMLDLGLKVSINSDDPAYFGGYVADNYLAIASALSASREALRALATNSLESAF